MAIIMKKNYNISFEKNEIEEITYLYNKKIINKILNEEDEFINNNVEINFDKIEELTEKIYENISSIKKTEKFEKFYSDIIKDDFNNEKSSYEYDEMENSYDLDDEISSHETNKFYKAKSKKEKSIYENDKSSNNSLNSYSNNSLDSYSSSLYEDDETLIQVPIENNKKESFENRKPIKTSFFMRIGHMIGLSLRNKYHKEIDNEIMQAIEKNELYRVLKAEKNGYFLGRKLGKIVLIKLYEEMLLSPSNLIEKLVKEDIMMSYDNLSIAILSKEGKELIRNENPEINPHAKTLYADLILKKDFLFANKGLWLSHLKNKEEFLKETNPIFYHDNMLSICEKSELEFVKKTLIKYSKDDDVLTSISKSKLIEDMTLILNIKLGNSINLDNVILDTPKMIQELYKSIKEITFTEDDIKILEANFKYDLDLVENKLPEALIKYISVDKEYRTTLKSVSGKNAEELLIETLENILITKKDLKLTINQQKLSDLSVTRRYTETLRGDSSRPSLFELKTAQQLKESGELLDTELPKVLEQNAKSGNMLKNKI